MSLIVNALGLGLIGLVVWYFLLAPRNEAGGARRERGIQRITVRVKGGYIPETIVAEPGVPLEIAFVREEDAPCSEEVVFPSLGVMRALPAFATTLVLIPPSPAGRYPFTCGMSMLRGTLLVGGVPAAPSSPPPEAVDPVCGMRVAPSQAAARLERGGTTHYFCSHGCRDRFAAASPPTNPE
jgi:plastocyanin domain-containing protein/YHS domain-containing protein